MLSLEVKATVPPEREKIRQPSGMNEDIWLEKASFSHS